jgi:hypothetical protein
VVAKYTPNISYRPPWLGILGERNLNWNTVFFVRAKFVRQRVALHMLDGQTKWSLFLLLFFFFLFLSFFFFFFLHHILFSHKDLFTPDEWFLHQIGVEFDHDLIGLFGILPANLYKTPAKLVSYQGSLL